MSRLRRDNDELIIALKQCRHERDRMLVERTKAGDQMPQRLGDNSMEARFYPPANEDLTELASKCGVRLDEPPILGLEPGRSGEQGAAIGLAEGEVELVDETIAALHASFLARLRPLYVEATGDEAGANGLSPRAMMAEIRATALSAEMAEAARQIALERAGQGERSEGEEESLAEQMLRLRVGLGDEFQAALSESLGVERAEELRSEAGGWPWARSVLQECSRGM